MKAILIFIYKLLCLFFLTAFLISCCTQYIPPLKFSYITLFSVAFPYLFILIILLCIISFFISRRIAVVLLICLVFSYPNLSKTSAFNFSSSFKLQKQDSSLRIMTWNVEDFVDLMQGANVRAQMLQLIAKNNPDVLCLQEFTEVEGGKWRVSVQKELDSLGFKYHFLSQDGVTVNKFDRKVSRGVAIFSKNKFADSARINIRDSVINENLVYTTFLLNQKPLRIYTAHLASFELYKDTVENEKKDIYKITYNRKRAIEYKLRETEQLHQQQVEIIKNALSKSPYPVVYCGDMNTTPCSYNYRILRSNLQDAFLEKGLGIGATFYKVLLTLRIDFCFADAAFKIDQCYVAQRKLSDHYPVITDISWK